MKQSNYSNIRALLSKKEFKNFKIFDLPKIPVKELELDLSNPDLDRYIIPPHHAYSAINNNLRVVLPHGTKPMCSEIEIGKKFDTGAYSKSTRPFVINKNTKFTKLSSVIKKLSLPQKELRKIEHRVRSNKIFNTASTGFGGAFQSSLNLVRHGNSLRYLTPLESERIMTWPDDWTKFGKNLSGEIYELTDSDRYHLCGNGIVSEVPKVITSHIKEKIRVFSNFSGADGSCLSLNSNFETVAFCEFDNIPSDILRYRYPDKPNYGDITKINIPDVPEFDMIFISAPCQTFSKAGKRAGFEDARGTLFFESAKIIKERRPKYILFENVKDLISHDKGRTLEVILSVFVELGYGGMIDVLNASDFGAPQARERVFILAQRIDD